MSRVSPRNSMTRESEKTCAPHKGTVETVDNRPLHLRYNEQFDKVKDILYSSDKFSKTIVDQEGLDYYNNLGLNEYYFQSSSAEMIATNLQCVIAAKLLNSACESDVFPTIEMETDHEVFLMAKSSLLNRKQCQNYTVEKKLEERYLSLCGVGQPWRVQCFRSTGSLFDKADQTDERLRTYFLQKPEYPKDVSGDDYKSNVDTCFEANKHFTATERIYKELNELVVNDPTGLQLFTRMESRGGELYRLDFAFKRGPHAQNFFTTVGDSISMWGFFSRRKYVEPLRNGVVIMSFFIREMPRDVLDEFKYEPGTSVEERLRRLEQTIKMQYVLPRSEYTEMAQQRVLTVNQAAYAWAVSKFTYVFSRTVGPEFANVAEALKGSHVSSLDLYSIRSRLRQPPYTDEFISQSCASHPEIVKSLYTEFKELCDAAVYTSRGNVMKEFEEVCPLSLSIEKLERAEVATMFSYFRLFNKCVIKTNFWSEKKLCLAFRLSPEFLPSADYDVRPYGVFYMAGYKFVGFHCRFQEIARGGIRIVQSLNKQSYSINRQRSFDECYNLARTQHYKNKDIPEGGSKGVILLGCTESREEADALTPNSFKIYMDGLLDLLLTRSVSEGGVILDRDNKTEVVFCGPDEFTGTGGLMDWACEHARRRGAWFWKAFTTGKDRSRGGIPHDMYGMTTTSVEQYVRGVLLDAGIKEEQATKVMTGGPDGDLGSNSILMSNMKTIAVVDGSGILFDPVGLDKVELRRLAHLRFNGKQTHTQLYDKPMSDQGCKISVAQNDVKGPGGEVFTSGRRLRDEFHLHEDVVADVFNPNGGRPEAINSSNVSRMFKKTGEPRFKYIIEGGNLFMTQDARRTLERGGVILFKDASVNKGGVTSSSYEVLAALSLTDEQFDNTMRVRPGNDPPQFYLDYVKSVQEKIRYNAQCEFELLLREGRANKTIMRCDLTDILSHKIIYLDNEIQNNESLWKDNVLRETVLKFSIPEILLETVNLNEIQERVPETYIKSIFSSVLASQFYYKYGVDASPFSLLSFVQDVRDGCLTKMRNDMKERGVDLHGWLVDRTGNN
eukprot:GHVR01171441.1.p1 GENE.GHVR01171441.1~~GHVR01171441.1.p1  ORF type:complete len:1065 (-),score=227.69 GHVR01171441.1:264-3458(-)